MRRVILLALLALALPTAALASSFDFPSGNFVSGTISGMFAAGRTINVSLVGTTNTLNIVTGTLSTLPCGTLTCFTFAGGTITVPTQSGFTTAVLSGTIVRFPANDVSISYVLATTATVKSGSGAFDFHFSSIPGALTRGEAGVQGQFTPVPEPGTLGLLELGLLGNGVMGLAGIVRRKLKLGT